MKTKCVVLVLMALACVASAADPTYEPLPTDSNVIIASGVADATGPGGTVYVEYWIWQGAQDYYYYTYRIHNTADPGFEPFVKHLWIGNPTGMRYVITSSSSGGDGTGTAWTPSVWDPLGEADLVSWSATDTTTFVHPGQSSLEEPLFQFASLLPPAIANFKVLEGTPQTYADGLIPAPQEESTGKPRSPGFWKHQFIGKGRKKELPGNLVEYMFNIVLRDAPELPVGGTVFANRISTTDGALNYNVVGPAIINPDDSSIMRAKTERQLFALWMNLESNKLSYYKTLTFEDPIGAVVSKSAIDVINEVETILQNPSATNDQLEYAKDLAEILNHL